MDPIQQNLRNLLADITSRVVMSEVSQNPRLPNIYDEFDLMLENCLTKEETPIIRQYTTMSMASARYYFDLTQVINIQPNNPNMVLMQNIVLEVLFRVTIYFNNSADYNAEQCTNMAMPILDEYFTSYNFVVVNQNAYLSNLINLIDYFNMFLNQTQRHHEYDNVMPLGWVGEDFVSIEMGVA